MSKPIKTSEKLSPLDQLQTLGDALTRTQGVGRQSLGTELESMGKLLKLGSQLLGLATKDLSLLESKVSLRDRVQSSPPQTSPSAENKEAIDSNQASEKAIDFEQIRTIFKQKDVKEAPIEEAASCKMALPFFKKAELNLRFDGKISLRHYILRLLHSMYNFTVTSSLANEFAELLPSSDKDQFRKKWGLTKDSLCEKNKDLGVCISYFLTLSGLWDCAISSILSRGASADPVFIVNCKRIGMAKEDTQDTFKTAVRKTLFSLVTEKEVLPHEAILKSLKLLYRFERKRTKPTDWTDFLSLPQLESVAKPWREAIDKLTTYELLECPAGLMGLSLDSKPLSLSDFMANHTLFLWQEHLPQLLKTTSKNLQETKETLKDNARQEVKGNQRSSISAVKKQLESTPLFAAINTLIKKINSLQFLHLRRYQPLHAHLHSLKLHPENGLYVLSKFNHLLKLMDRPLYQIINELTDCLPGIGQDPDMKGIEAPLIDLIEDLDTMLTFLEEWQERFEHFYQTLPLTDKISSTEIDESIFETEAPPSSAVEILDGEEEKEELSLIAPKVTPSLKDKAQPHNDSAHTQHLEKIEQTLRQIAENQHPSLIDSFSHYMVYRKEKIQERLIERQIPISSRRLQEVVDHVILMSQGIELLGNVCILRRFDLLGACVQSYIIDSHVALEQFFSLFIKAKTGIFSQKHFLDQLGRESGLALGDKQREFLKSHSLGLLWARYFRTYLEDYTHSQTPLPPPLAWLQIASQNPTEPQALEILKGVIASYKNTLVLLVGEDEILDKIDTLQQVLEVSLSKPAPLPAVTPASEPTPFDTAKLEIEKRVRNFDRNLAIGNKNPLLSLQEITQYIRWMQEAHSIQQLFPQRSLNYWHYRFSLNIDKLFKHLFTVACNLNQLGTPYWHTLTPYITALEERGWAFTPQNKVVLRQINTGISHHYPHTHSSPLTDTSLAVLKQSIAEIGAPLGFGVVGGKRNVLQDFHGQWKSALQIFCNHLLPKTLEQLDGQ